MDRNNVSHVYVLTNLQGLCELAKTELFKKKIARTTITKTKDDRYFFESVAIHDWNCDPVSNPKAAGNADNVREFIDVLKQQEYYEYVRRKYIVGKPETEVPAMGALTGSSGIYIDYSAAFPNTSHAIDLFEPNVTFEKMEEFLVSHKLTETKEPIKFDENTYYYNLVPGVQTADELSETGYATVKKFMVFKDPKLKWLEIKYEVKHTSYKKEIRSIIVTDDHPLPIWEDGVFVRTLAKDIQVNDQLVSCVSKLNTVVGITELTEQYAGYDIETSTDRFNVNDIVSHSCRTRTISNIHDPSKEQVTVRSIVVEVLGSPDADTLGLEPVRLVPVLNEGCILSSDELAALGI